MKKLLSILAICCSMMAYSDSCVGIGLNKHHDFNDSTYVFLDSNNNPVEITNYWGAVVSHDNSIIHPGNKVYMMRTCSRCSEIELCETEYPIYNKGDGFKTAQQILDSPLPKGLYEGIVDLTQQSRNTIPGDNGEDYDVKAEVINRWLASKYLNKKATGAAMFIAFYSPLKKNETGFQKAWKEVEKQADEFSRWLYYSRCVNIELTYTHGGSERTQPAITCVVVESHSFVCSISGLHICDKCHEGHYSNEYVQGKDWNGLFGSETKHICTHEYFNIIAPGGNVQYWPVSRGFCTCSHDPCWEYDDNMHWCSGGGDSINSSCRIGRSAHIKQKKHVDCDKCSGYNVTTCKKCKWSESEEHNHEPEDHPDDHWSCQWCGSDDSSIDHGFGICVPELICSTCGKGYAEGDEDKHGKCKCVPCESCQSPNDAQYTKTGYVGDSGCQCSCHSK